MRPANYITWAASALGAASGLLAQATASQSSQVASAGLTVAIGSIATAASTILLALIKGYWDDRAAERAAADRRAEREANIQGQFDQQRAEMERQKAEAERQKAEDRRETAEAKAKADAAEAKVHQAIQETDELRRQLGDVPANKARIAATDGKLDAVLEELRLSGFLKPPKPGEGQRSPRTTVLIAEDDPNQARALQTLLTAKGYAASSAVTMEEGFSLLEKGPHLMILDLRIQGKDGLDLLRKVRADGKLTRTVIITGMADPVELAKAEALRPDKVLKKPVDFEELLEVLTPLGAGRDVEDRSDGPRPA
jgi:CheY-like chemotaxis protein